MERKDRYSFAVLGATGAVGRRMLSTLERRGVPVGEVRLLASPRSAGTRIPFRGEELVVEAVRPESFDGVDIALFSAGAAASEEWAPVAVERGAVVIDNSSAFRMHDDVPLVVPEVNPHALAHHRGIIANPNCSTIQLVVVLHALREFGLEHVTISTYQAVSGMGQRAVDALLEEVRRAEAGERDVTTVFPVVKQDRHVPMAFNVIPQCDIFLDNGYTKEEMKLVNESRKILEIPSLRVTPTAVRVPVLYGHAESVAVRFRDPVGVAEVRDRLAKAENVVLVDDPASALYPHPRMAEDRGETFVGRIRQDLEDPHTILFFIVADNLLKGAAWNAVQIAEKLMEMAR